MRRHCRLWWPKQLLSNKESSSSILLGWFVTCSPSSLDIIAAFTCSEVLLSSYSPGIQMVSGMIQCNEGIIYGTWGSMPSVLEDKSKFSVLGLCVTDPTTSNGLMNGKEDDKKKFSEYGNALQEGGTDRKNNSRSCRCFQLDGSLRKSSQYVLGRSNWVLVMFDSPEQNDVGIHRLPKLHHIHWNGLTMSQYDVPVRFMLSWGTCFPNFGLRSPPCTGNFTHFNSSLVHFTCIFITDTGISSLLAAFQSNSTASPSADFTDEITSYKESLHLKDFNREKSSSLVSALHSNYLSIGEARCYL
ncbi:hypothetical protein JHK85_054305 [Glycine max]|nr:hypothetical protein JHK85_054305 [Glycine max]